MEGGSPARNTRSQKVSSTITPVVITTYVWLRTSASGRSTRLARLKVTFKSPA